VLTKSCFDLVQREKDVNCYLCHSIQKASALTKNITLLNFKWPSLFENKNIYTNITESEHIYIYAKMHAAYYIVWLNKL
jgi:hypothetical protein